MLNGDRVTFPAVGSFAVRVASFYGALFVVYGAQLPFLPLWLEARGLTPYEIGLATSLPLLARLLVAPVIAIVADRHNAHARVTAVLAGAALATSLVMPLASGHIAISVAVLVFLVSVQSAMPLAETIAMRGVRTAELDYGRMRLWGSVTFIATNLAGGILIDALGRDSIAGLLVFGSALTLVAASLLPQPDRATARADSGAVAGTRPIVPWSAAAFAPVGRVLGSPAVVLLLLATGAIQASHAIFYTFGAVHWRSQGLGSHWIGALWAIGVVVEVALFALSAAAIRAIGPLGLLAAGGLAGVGRWLVMAMDPPLLVLVPLQVLHAATFGATHLAGMHLISELVDDRDAGTAQTLGAAITGGIVMGAAIAMSGPLYAALGAKSYAVMALMSAVGLAAATLLARQRVRAVR